MDYFKDQDNYVKAMVEAYKNGRLGAVFHPYIQWKIVGHIFSKDQAYVMMNATNDLLYGMFDEPNVDEELRSFLEGIDSEITSILPMLI